MQPNEFEHCVAIDCIKPCRPYSFYCEMHYKRWWRHGDVNIKLPTGNQKGARNKEVVPYRQAHRRIEIDRGKASQYVCVCGSTAEQWAYQHNDPNEQIGISKGKTAPYSLDTNNYMPMCRSCHTSYDKSPGDYTWVI